MAWKNILDNRYLLSKGISWILINYQIIKSCYDHWVRSSLLINKTKPNAGYLTADNLKGSNLLRIQNNGLNP